MDKSLLSKGNTNTSFSRILGAPSFMRGNDFKESKNKNQEMNPEGEESEDIIQISQSISEADPYDFGYYKLIRKVENVKEESQEVYNNPNKSQLFNVVQNAIRNVNRFSIKKMNLLRSMNEIQYDETDGRTEKVIKNNKELIYRFAREENDYTNFNIPSVGDLKVKSVQKGRTNTMGEKKVEHSGEEILQTMNSFVVNQQIYEINKDNLDNAHKINYEYTIRKQRYELEIVMKLINKFEESQKPASKIVVEFSKPYTELKRESSKLLEKLKKDIGLTKLNDYKAMSIISLIEFIKRIEREVDDKPSKTKDLEVKKFKNYSKWKKKLCELVNIWELFSSNGISMKFPIKYLILKKYLSTRSIMRQQDLEKGGKNEEDGNFIMKIIFDLLGLTGQSKSVPKSIFMPNELINILSEILMAFCLLYSLFSIPMVAFLDMPDDATSIIDKYIDVVYFVELTTNFRKVFRDKANEYVYDIRKIFSNYIFGSFVIDLMSTMPWYFFVISNLQTYYSMKIWVMCFKIFRVIKLSPVISKLESLKGANYVRLFKLVFIFFFFAHWMGCILYSSITNSLSYDQLMDSCYTDNQTRSKDNISFVCRYFMAIYNAAYIIPGQYTQSMSGLATLSTSGEYGTYIILYMIGQVLAAYIFGGMASTIQNLNQGQNFFTNKMDMLNEHMNFYDVNVNTMKDVKLYYEYMWQRHKDVIYGKHHFDTLSRSLREKFERLNLPGNEILLAKFYNLNPGNTKLIGNILMNLSKVILFPYEILFEVDSVTKGLYILLNGDVELSNPHIQTIKANNYLINYADIMEDLMNNKKNNLRQPSQYDEKNSIVFPLLSALIKTGRNWQRCFSCNFTDLLFLPLKTFDDILYNFPIEMHIMKHQIMEWVSQKKLFDNSELFKILSKPSSRSVGRYFEKEYDKISIWITIPIPISQRKIASNYIDSFIKKVRNQWREIKITGDLNVCLNSFSVINLIKSLGKNKSDKEENKLTSVDPVDNIKALTKEIEKLTEKYLIEFKV